MVTQCSGRVEYVGARSCAAVRHLGLATPSVCASRTNAGQSLLHGKDEVDRDALVSVVISGPFVGGRARRFVGCTPCRSPPTD